MQDPTGQVRGVEKPFLPQARCSPWISFLVWLSWKHDEGVWSSVGLLGLLPVQSHGYLTPGLGGLQLNVNICWGPQLRVPECNGPLVPRPWPSWDPGCAQGAVRRWPLNPAALAPICVVCGDHCKNFHLRMMLQADPWHGVHGVLPVPYSSE